MDDFILARAIQPGLREWGERFEHCKPGLPGCQKTGSLTGRDRMLQEGIVHLALDSGACETCHTKWQEPAARLGVTSTAVKRSSDSIS